MQTAIKWFANNPVAANLLMFFLIITGLYGALTTNQEEFPNFELKVIAVTVPYLGAAPIEAEKAVCVRIEEAIEGVEGIEKLYGMATEGQCTVSAMLFSDADEVTATNEIKSRVDGINSFPVETEKPIYSGSDDSKSYADSLVRTYKRIRAQRTRQRIARANSAG